MPDLIIAGQLYGMQDKMSDAVAQGVIFAEQVAGSILGERCWVRWPFLQEALVQAVSDRSHKVRKKTTTPFRVI